MNNITKINIGQHKYHYYSDDRDNDNMVDIVNQKSPYAWTKDYYVDLSEMSFDGLDLDTINNVIERRLEVRDNVRNNFFLRYEADAKSISLLGETTHYPITYTNEYIPEIEEETEDDYLSFLTGTNYETFNTGYIDEIVIPSVTSTDSKYGDYNKNTTRTEASNHPWKEAVMGRWYTWNENDASPSKTTIQRGLFKSQIINGKKIKMPLKDSFVYPIIDKSARLHKLHAWARFNGIPYTIPSPNSYRPPKAPQSVTDTRPDYIFDRCLIAPDEITGDIPKYSYGGFISGYLLNGIPDNIDSKTHYTDFVEAKWGSQKILIETLSYNNSDYSSVNEDAIITRRIFVTPTTQIPKDYYIENYSWVNNTNEVYHNKSTHDDIDKEIECGFLKTNSEYFSFQDQCCTWIDYTYPRMRIVLQKDSIVCDKNSMKNKENGNTFYEQDQNQHKENILHVSVNNGPTDIKYYVLEIPKIKYQVENNNNKTFFSLHPLDKILNNATDNIQYIDTNINFKLATNADNKPNVALDVVFGRGGMCEVKDNNGKVRVTGEYGSEELWREIIVNKIYEGCQYLSPSYVKVITDDGDKKIEDYLKSNDITEGNFKRFRSNTGYIVIAVSDNGWRCLSPMYYFDTPYCTVKTMNDQDMLDESGNPIYENDNSTGNNPTPVKGKLLIINVMPKTEYYSHLGYPYRITCHSEDGSEYTWDIVNGHNITHLENTGQLQEGSQVDPWVISYGYEDGPQTDSGDNASTDLDNTFHNLLSFPLNSQEDGYYTFITQSELKITEIHNKKFKYETPNDSYIGNYVFFLTHSGSTSYWSSQVTGMNYPNTKQLPYRANNIDTNSTSNKGFEYVTVTAINNNNQNYYLVPLYYYNAEQHLYKPYKVKQNDLSIADYGYGVYVVVNQLSDTHNGSLEKFVNSSSGQSVPRNEWNYPNHLPPSTVQADGSFYDSHPLSNKVFLYFDTIINGESNIKYNADKKFYYTESDNPSNIKIGFFGWRGCSFRSTATATELDMEGTHEIRWYINDDDKLDYIDMTDVTGLRHRCKIKKTN